MYSPSRIALQDSHCRYWEQPPGKEMAPQGDQCVGVGRPAAADGKGTVPSAIYRWVHVGRKRHRLPGNSRGSLIMMACVTLFTINY